MRLWVRQRLGRGIGRRCARRILVGVPLLVGATLFTFEEIRECGGVGLPLDDAWIYAALARDLAEGSPAGAVDPPPGHERGGHPLAAATSPLWCLILAAGRVVLAPWTEAGDPDGSTAVWLSRTAGLIAGWIACALAYRVATRVSGLPSVGWAIAVLLAVQPRFVRGVVSGFEVPLYVGLTLAGVEAHLRWRDSPGLRGVGAPIFFALAGWARPECFLLLVLERLVTGFMGQGGGRRGAALVKSVVTGGLLAAPFGLFFFWLWGHPLPSSFAVKAQDASLLSGSGEGLLAALWNSLSFQFGVWGGYLPALFIPLLPAFVLGARRLLADETRRGAFLPIALVGFLLLHAPMGPALPLQFGRRNFVLPVLYLLVVAAGLRPETAPRRRGAGVRWSVGLAGLVCVALCARILAGAPSSAVGYMLRWLYYGEGEAYGPESASTVGEWTVPVCGAVALGHLGVGLGLWAIPGAVRGRFALALTGIGLLQSLAGWPRAAATHAHQVRDTQELNVAAARWVRDHLPADARVAVHDFGAMAYFSRRRLLDLEGLGSPWTIRYRSRGREGLVEVFRLARPSHYVGAPGGMGDRYGMLGTRVSADVPPLYVKRWDSNRTVISPMVLVLRLRWPEEPPRVR